MKQDLNVPRNTPLPTPADFEAAKANWMKYDPQGLIDPRTKEIRDPHAAMDREGVAEFMGNAFFQFFAPSSLEDSMIAMHRSPLELELLGRTKKYQVAHGIGTIGAGLAQLYMLSKGLGALGITGTGGLTEKLFGDIAFKAMKMSRLADTVALFNARETLGIMSDSIRQKRFDLGDAFRRILSSTAKGTVFGGVAQSTAGLSALSRAGSIGSSMFLMDWLETRDFKDAAVGGITIALFSLLGNMKVDQKVKVQSYNKTLSNLEEIYFQKIVSKPGFKANLKSQTMVNGTVHKGAYNTIMRDAWSQARGMAETHLRSALRAQGVNLRFEKKIDGNGKVIGQKLVEIQGASAKKMDRAAKVFEQNFKKEFGQTAPAPQTAPASAVAGQKALSVPSTVPAKAPISPIPTPVPPVQVKPEIEMVSKLNFKGKEMYDMPRYVYHSPRGRPLDESGSIIALPLRPTEKELANGF